MENITIQQNTTYIDGERQNLFVNQPCYRVLKGYFFKEDIKSEQFLQRGEKRIKYPEVRNT